MESLSSDGEKFVGIRIRYGYQTSGSKLPSGDEKGTRPSCCSRGSVDVIL
jgi:hypothetical protein